MSSTAPFLLSPHLAERVWGGDRFGAGIGEAWDLSVHPNGHSVVASGPHRGRSLAEVVAERPADFGGPIDLLAKRLDCAARLSVQVHPRTGDPKTEAWVVLDAEPGAGVYLGFADAPDPEVVRSAALDGSLADLLAFRELAVGDAVFVPAGTVHAIGGGLTLFELQQSSDTTYRLFDWGRTGRELHLDEGLGCADLAPAPETRAPARSSHGVTRLVECPYFSIERIDASGPVTVEPGHRWTALHVVAGTARAGGLTLSEGDTMMVPASAGPVELDPDAGFVALRYGPPTAG
ncbi:MAG: hypothetical protein U5K29_03350 [Acidimicrobiales bacterium]|nr:hypothetical protein [Acidimicrobiales bacterium]